MSENLIDVEFKYWNGEDYIKSIAVGYDFDIGITAVKKDNKEQAQFCLHGPSSPLLKDEWEWEGDSYKVLFDKISKGIKEGIIRCFELDHWFEEVSTKSVAEADIKNCPFNQ